MKLIEPLNGLGKIDVEKGRDFLQYDEERGSEKWKRFVPFLNE